MIEAYFQLIAVIIGGVYIMNKFKLTHNCITRIVIVLEHAFTVTQLYTNVHGYTITFSVYLGCVFSLKTFDNLLHNVLKNCHEDNFATVTYMHTESIID